MENIRETVTSRRSVRTYDGRALSGDDTEKLLSFTGGIANPYNIPLRFKLLDRKEHGLSCPVVNGTDCYIAAAIDKIPHAEEAFGYSFEMFVLYAQSLGIGTVWLGGTMDRGAFEKAMGLQDNERMPCASPLGYPARMSLKESMMRKAVRADSRDTFETLFFNESFESPLKESEAGALAMPLEMVRWAPSAVNKQPWRVVLRGGAAHFYLRHTKGFVSDAVGDMQKIDMGIALCHFELAAREAGLDPVFVISDPGMDAKGMEYIASYSYAV